MDRARFSALAHSSHSYCNPISAPAIEHALDLIASSHALPGAAPLASALDIGCGKAELLLRLCERFPAPFRALGIENSPLMLDQGQKRAATRNVSDRVLLRLSDAEHVVPLLPGSSFDLVSCIGSSHALHDVLRTLEHMARVVTRRGHILLGEGCWKKEPDPAYLAALGASESELTTHEANEKLGAPHNLRLVWSTTASDEDWDAYENAYAANIETFARENPQDPDVPAMLERSRRWHALYRDHGRTTMGFGLYLFNRG
ncbi:MAG: class I SAM-dependent methyltransferase [Phycisphaerales bacterium]|nr:class I SAM-dependent methyltransferase [Planctomycetota bacterium]